jgi:hypothetical protein
MSSAVEKFTRGASQAEDGTLLPVRYRGFAEDDSKTA